MVDVQFLTRLRMLRSTWIIDVVVSESNMRILQCMIVMRSSMSIVSGLEKRGSAVLSPCSHRGQKFAGPDEQAKLGDREFIIYGSRSKNSDDFPASPLHPQYIPKFLSMVGSQFFPDFAEARIAAVFRYLDPGGEGTVSLKAMGLLHRSQPKVLDGFGHFLIQSIPFFWLSICNPTTHVLVEMFNRS